MLLFYLIKFETKDFIVHVRIVLRPGHLSGGEGSVPGRGKGDQPPASTHRAHRTSAGHLGLEKRFRSLSLQTYDQSRF